MSTELINPESKLTHFQKMASSPDISPEKLRELLAVQAEWEAMEAKKKFNSAIATFQKVAPIVEKGDDANGKPFAAMDRIWRTVRPDFTGLGLSIVWLKTEIRELGALGLVCHLEGLLGHCDGHREALVSDVPIPDAITNASGKAVQNKAQVMGSAITYAKRYAFCAATGLVLGDDDDGNGGVKTTITPEEQTAIKDALDAWRGVAGWTEEREAVFWRFVNVPTLASGNHDLSKLPMARLADVLDLLKRSIAGPKKS